MAITKSFGPEELTIAGSAVNFLVGPVAGENRIKWSMTFCTVEALLVPHLQKWFVTQYIESGIKRVNSLKHVSEISKITLTVPFASCCSAAKTIPPHLGQPWPGGALIDVVSGL